MKSKSLPVIQYNKFTAGIDKQDQMLAYYSCERKTIRGPTKIFVHILQLMISNSHFLYNKYSTKNMSLHDFRLSVIRYLLTFVLLRVIQLNQNMCSNRRKKRKVERYCESSAKVAIPRKNAKIPFISAKFLTDLPILDKLWEGDPQIKCKYCLQQ